MPFSTVEAAKKIGVGHSAVWKWARSGAFSGVSQGSKGLILSDVTVQQMADFWVLHRKEPRKADAVGDTMLCTVCNADKPTNEFRWLPAREAYESACISCFNTRTGQREKAKRARLKQENPGFLWLKDKKKWLWNLYKLTWDGYQAILIHQKGLCAICQRVLRTTYSPDGRKRKADDDACVDHDHVTGKVRGILCHACNFGVGHLLDDPLLLRKAADYLESDHVWQS